MAGALLEGAGGAGGAEAARRTGGFMATDRGVSRILAKFTTVPLGRMVAEEEMKRFEEGRRLASPAASSSNADMGKGREWARKWNFRGLRMTHWPDSLQSASPSPDSPDSWS